MPHLPEWLVIVCILFPIVTIIYRLFKNNREK